mgnify:CR=1 FL=1
MPKRKDKSQTNSRANSSIIILIILISVLITYVGPQANFTASALASCTDSDGGLDYYTYGYVKTWITYRDSCTSSTQLKEYYCSGTAAYVYYNCPNGCSGGKCDQPSPEVNVSNISASRSHLKYVGYWDFAVPINFSDINKTHSYTNLFIMNVKESNLVQSSLEYFKEHGKPRGMKLMLYFGLDADNALWNSKMKGIADNLTSLDLWNDVIAINLVDEPTIRTGYNNDILYNMVSTAENYFRDKPLTMDFFCQNGTTYTVKKCDGSLSKVKCDMGTLPPENLDWLSIDPYFAPCTSNAGGINRDRYISRVKPDIDWAIKWANKSANRSVVLIPQSFYVVDKYGQACKSPWYGNLMPTPQQQRWYYDDAASNEKIVALQWYRYENYYPECSGGCLIGASSWPSMCFQKADKYANIIGNHTKWGKEILCNNTLEQNSVCGVDGKTYQNPDQAKCAGVAIGAYGSC